jgi:hypothetical protein
VIVYGTGSPVQFAGDALVGVTVMVAVIADAVKLVPVKDAILPAPLAAKPIAVLELVHV